MNALPVIFTVFIGLIAEIALQGINTEKQAIITECSNEFGLDEQAYKTKSVPDDKKCIYKCMSIKSGLMNDAGEITVDDFKSKYPDETPAMIETLSACATTSKKSDPCETAKALYVCFSMNREKNA